MDSIVMRLRRVGRSILVVRLFGPFFGVARRGVGMSVVTASFTNGGGFFIYTCRSIHR